MFSNWETIFSLSNLSTSHLHFTLRYFLRQRSLANKLLSDAKVIFHWYMLCVGAMGYAAPIIYHSLTYMFSMFRTLRLVEVGVANLFLMLVGQLAPLSFVVLHVKFSRVSSSSYNKYSNRRKSDRNSKIIVASRQYRVDACSAVLYLTYCDAPWSLTGNWHSTLINFR